MTHSKPIINDPVQENHPPHPIFGLLRKSVDLLLPERCYACGDIVGTSGGLCPSCWEKISFITDPLCEQCGRPFEYDVVGEVKCGDCLRHPPIYERARSCMAYDEGCRALILAFKHADRVDMAPALAGWLERAGDDVLEKADLIAPVPLHWTRLWSRRFNQSAELARHLAIKTGKTYAPDIIRRKRRTPSQANLRANARAKNVRGAFSVSKNPRVKLPVNGFY